MCSVPRCKKYKLGPLLAEIVIDLEKRFQKFDPNFQFKITCSDSGDPKDSFLKEYKKMGGKAVHVSMKFLFPQSIFKFNDPPHTLKVISKSLFFNLFRT